MYEDLIWSEDAGWIVSTPSPPTYSAEAIKARGSGADGAMEEVRRQWSEKLGKPLVWRLDGETWRLVDGPSTPTGRVVRKTF